MYRLTCFSGEIAWLAAPARMAAAAKLCHLLFLTPPPLCQHLVALSALAAAAVISGWRVRRSACNGGALACSRNAACGMRG